MGHPQLNFVAKSFATIGFQLDNTIFKEIFLSNEFQIVLSTRSALRKSKWNISSLNHLARYMCVYKTSMQIDLLRGFSIDTHISL